MATPKADKAAAFPAPAGMNPAVSGRFRTEIRVPRTRGDEPTFGAAGDFKKARSPHPRG